uniref:Uncharacterized protein n=1 Tax=Anguilla anguilla TaxID=7936 RepID=A0A0E9U349_ANGAN
MAEFSSAAPLEKWAQETKQAVDSSNGSLLF